jgi:SAM-dependent methyltransferase
MLLRDYKPYDRDVLAVEYLPGDAPNPREMDQMDERVNEFLRSMTLEDYVAAKGGLRWAADLIRQVVDRLDAPPKGTILEFGAGNAKLAAVLSALPSVDEIVINDFSEPLLTELAPRVISWLGGDLSKIRFVVGDMHRLPQIGRRFDAVVGYLVVHHLVLPEHFFGQIPAILEPGGTFIAFREPSFARFALPTSWTTRIRQDIHMMRRAGENEHRYTVDGYASLSRTDFDFKLLGIHDGSGFLSPRREHVSRLVAHVPYDIAYSLSPLPQSPSQV